MAHIYVIYIIPYNILLYYDPIHCCSYMTSHVSKNWPINKNDDNKFEAMHPNNLLGLI